MSRLFSLDLLEKTFGAPRYHYDAHGTRHSNISAWARKRFRARYGPAWVPQPLTADQAIFANVYAVLHNPVYRKKYARNLAYEYPRIPLYDDVQRWVMWGQRLLTWHSQWEAMRPYPLRRVDTRPTATPSAKLTAHAATRDIHIDSATSFQDVPPEVWRYQLAGRAAIAWMLTYYRERTPRDATIRTRFAPYRLADDKAHVISVLRRVVTVSLETAAVITAMQSYSQEP